MLGSTLLHVTPGHDWRKGGTRNKDYGAAGLLLDIGMLLVASKHRMARPKLFRKI